MILILLIVIIAVVVYLINSNYQYWTKRGVPGHKPVFFIGNLGPSFLKKKSPAQIFSDIYNQYPNAPFVGIFKSTTPCILLRDPELIKDVIVKSFNSFHDNEVSIDKKIDPLIGRHPFFLRGEEWKSTRVHLTPVFTSGKMKMVYPLSQDTSKELVKFIADQPDMTNGKGYEAREMCKRYMLSNVSRCAFGLEANVFGEEKNDFRLIADRFFQQDGFQQIKVLLITLMPFLSKVISIKFTPDDVEQTIIKIVTETLKYREQNNIVRNDFLHILDQLRKNSTDGIFTDIDVAAHAAAFLIDGYDTGALVMSFLLYELAANPEIQSKLRKEIDGSFQENGNDLPYEVVNGLPYLDAALCEALRMHPLLGSLHKLCTKPYTYVPKENDVIKEPVLIEPNTLVILPLYGLHRDPKYYEEPDSFKPERFLGENKEKITKFTYLPFGEGPRACLGQRFGILQTKIGVAHVLKNYYISVNRKTEQPIKYDPVLWVTMAKDGLWLDFKKIN